MGKQSSGIYGIKVKEHRNYFEYPANDPEIKIYYDANASKQWIIKSNYNSIWYNGQSYPSGYTVVSFKDGTDCQNNPFMLMAPHEEDGIIVNYFYRISGRFTSYPEVGSDEINYEETIPEPSEEEEQDVIRYTIESGHPGNHYSQLYVRKFVNDVETGHVIVTPESINAYKVAHASNYYNYLKVFNALLFDWRGMAPNIYEEPYSFILYSNVTYLEWNGITRMRHTKVTEWTWDTSVNMDIRDFSTQYPPVEPSDKDLVKYNIASNSNNAEIINIQKMVNNSVVITKTVSKNDILTYKNTNHGNPLRVFDNLLFDCQQLPASYPNYTFLITADNSYLKYDGEWINYGNEINSWPTNAFVNFEIEDYSNRYEQTVMEGDNYNVYIEHIKWDTQYQYWVNVDHDQPVALTKENVCYDIFHDHKEMYYNGHYHKAAWLVYDQPSEGYKKLGKLAIMWADPFWVLITTADGIYWNGVTYKGRKLLKMWHKDEAVNLTMTRTESRKKSVKDTDYDRVRYEVVTNNNDVKIKLTKYENDLKTTESTFNPLTTEQRTFSGIVLYCVDEAVIVMYSKSDEIRIGGINYPANEKIGEWLITDKVSYSIDDKKYQDVEYIMTTSELDNTITVVKQINDLEDDTIAFDPETDCPIDFHNIKFKYSNGKVSIYSKCDYIKLGGTTYKTGNLVITWDISEKVNFAVKDESGIYEIKKTTTYTVKTENVTETDYDITTLMDVHWTPLRICKVVNNKDSNEEIVNFYDCQYEPYFIYDNKLQIRYDPATAMWSITSLSDDIYKGSTNYPAGTVIEAWPYGENHHAYGIGHQEDSHYDVRIHSVEVDSSASYETTHEYITNPTYRIVTQSDNSLDVTNDQPGSLPVTRNIRYMDAMSWYTFFGLLFKYNPTTSEWEVKAGNNLIVIGQTLYKKGEIVSKWDYYEDVNKTISTLVEDIKHTTRDDKEKDLLVSCNSMWLYGYIWEKESTPPPPVWINFILSYMYASYRSGYYNMYGSLWFIDNTDLQNLNIKKALRYYGYRWDEYSLYEYKNGFLGRIFLKDNYYTNDATLVVCDNITDSNPNFEYYNISTNKAIIDVLNYNTVICSNVVWYQQSDSFLYQQYTLFESGVSNLSYEVVNEDSDFCYNLRWLYGYSNGSFYKIFGQTGKFLLATRYMESVEFAFDVLDPYTNTVEHFTSSFSINYFPKLNEFAIENSYCGWDIYSPQPEDIGKHRLRPYFKYMSYQPGGRLEEVRQFVWKDKIYIYLVAVVNEFELTGRYEYGRWYYGERYLDTTIYYKVAIYDLITKEDYLKDVTPFTNYMNFPYQVTYGEASHLTEYFPDSYYRLFYGNFEYMGNTYFVGLLYGDYTPQQQSDQDPWTRKDKYCIFKLNEETDEVDTLVEIQSDSYIMINKYDPYSEEFDGQLKFYYRNETYDEELGYDVPIDPDAYSIFSGYTNYSERPFLQNPFIDVHNIPLINKNGIFLKQPHVKNTDATLYIYFDNPYFRGSGGNFCMLLTPDNINR